LLKSSFTGEERYSSIAERERRVFSFCCDILQQINKAKKEKIANSGTVQITQQQSITHSSLVHKHAWLGRIKVAHSNNNSKPRTSRLLARKMAETICIMHPFFFLISKEKFQLQLWKILGSIHSLQEQQNETRIKREMQESKTRNPSVTFIKQKQFLTAQSISNFPLPIQSPT
jgi:hypothetical protein